MKYGGNLNDFLRQSVSAAALGTAMHEALAEYHVGHDEYHVPSFTLAQSRIESALGYDPYNHIGVKL